MPLLADFKPSGKYVMEDLHGVGGMPARDEDAAREGLIDGDCMTVTGKTIAENLADAAGLGSRAEDRSAARQNPIKNDRPHPDSARQPRARRRGGEDHRQRRAALLRARRKVFDSEEDMLHALEQKEIDKGDVIVIRYEGPKGRPGHAGDADADVGHHGRGTRQGRRADHRRPIFRRLARLHRRPHHARSAGRRADRAGPQRRPHHDRRREATIDVDVSDDGARKRASGMEARRRLRPRAARWRSTSAWCKSASEGCVTDE